MEERYEPDQEHYDIIHGAEDGGDGLGYTKADFINKLRGYEGGIGGKKLRELLGWPKDVFDAIRNELKKDGLIHVGKGQGGSISLTVSHYIIDDVLETVDVDNGVDVVRFQEAAEQLVLPAFLDKRADTEEGEKDGS